jgi:hypothetical protein
MSDVHRIMLLDAGPAIAEQFRTDPGVASLIDPAVWMDTDAEGYAAVIIERLEVVESLSPFSVAEGAGVAAPPPPERPITVVVVDHSSKPPSAVTYNVADPRKEPTSWPWMGPGDDDDEESD